MDRRSFIQSSVAVGVVGTAACTDAGVAPGATSPTGFPGRTGNPGERDWAAMSRVDMKPPRPIGAHVRAVGSGVMATTNVIVDAEGNVAAGTHSSSSEPFGTGINIDGVVMNRVTYLRKYTDLPVGFSTQLWLYRNGRPALVMATPSRSLMECLLQGAASFVEYGMDGEQVVQAPRFGHPHPGIASAEIEGDFGDDAIAELEARGHALFPVSPRDANMGSIHAVRRLDDGRLEGVADPRRRGRASGGAVE